MTFDLKLKLVILLVLFWIACATVWFWLAIQVGKEIVTDSHRKMDQVEEVINWHKI